jgi:hypothetical protein
MKNKCLVLLIVACIVLVCGLFFFYKPIKTVTSSTGITNIYTDYGQSSTLKFDKKIKLVLIKQSGKFRCNRNSNSVIIEPLLKDASTDMLVVLSDKTAYRLILVENNGERFNKEVRFQSSIAASKKVKSLILNFETISYCLGLAGSIVFAWSFIAVRIKRFARELNAFFTTNYFEIKYAAFSKCQTISGIILLTIALFTTLVSYEYPNYPIYQYSNSISLYTTPVLIITVCLLIFIPSANYVACKIAFPYLKDSFRNQNEKFKTEFWDNIDLNPEVKEITYAREFIENMELLFDLSIEGSLKDRMTRVEKFFES